MRPASLPLLAAAAALAGLVLVPSALAQDKKTSGFGSSKDPVDISAKSTEVFSPEHRVVYRGEVEAIQGQQRLRTPELTLFFAQKEGAPKAATSSGGLGEGFGSIQRMEAEGPVYLVTPTQSAKGDHGTYDAVSDTMTLIGNVVLLQDKNVARGDKLVIDQKSGHSTLSSGAQTRVRGVFYPQEQAQAAPPPAAPVKR
jgi:lipopolysaccharide export system protein LptA